MPLSNSISLGKEGGTINCRPAVKTSNGRAESSQTKEVIKEREGDDISKPLSARSVETDKCHVSQVKE